MGTNVTSGITFLGAAGMVTGSRYLLETAGRRYLVDCGLFQGGRPNKQLNWNPFPIKPERIDAVLLTHAHIDHTGYLPRLIRQGFRGPVYATEATIALLEILLPDSAYLQEQEAAFANTKGYTRHKPALLPFRRRPQFRPQPADGRAGMPAALPGDLLRPRRCGIQATQHNAGAGDHHLGQRDVHRGSDPAPPQVAIARRAQLGFAGRLPGGGLARPPIAGRSFIDPDPWRAGARSGACGRARRTVGPRRSR